MGTHDFDRVGPVHRWTTSVRGDDCGVDLCGEGSDGSAVEVGSCLDTCYLRVGICECLYANAGAVGGRCAPGRCQGVQQRHYRERGGALPITPLTRAL